MKKNILMALFVVAMLMAVSCAEDNSPETDGGQATDSVETNDVESSEETTDQRETTSDAETDPSDTGMAETDIPETNTAAEPYDYMSNDLTPYVTVGNYMGLSVTIQPTELTDAEYEAELADLMESYSYNEMITDRAVEEGETVVTSYSGYQDGVQFQGGTSEEAEVTAADGTGYIDGFGSAFIGQMPGVEFSFNVTFPDNYGNSDLAGEEVTFVCTISHIMGENMITPELTDAFVYENFGYESVAEFETAFRDFRAEQKKYEIEAEMNNDLWEQVLEASVILGYPEGEIDYYVNLINADMEQTAMMYGIDYADFILYYVGMTEEEYNETVLEQAHEYVKENLILYQIAKEQNITVTEERFNEEVAALAEMNGVSEVVIISYYGRDNLMLSLLQNEVFNAIAGFADITIEEITE